MGCKQSTHKSSNKGHSRKRITLDGIGEVLEPLHLENKQEHSFNIADFLTVHEQFMTVKKLEGLSAKTLSDHLNLMEYFKRWLQSEVPDYENLIVEKGIFLQYTAYLFHKEYKPCTINIRLRTIKCYLRWLYNEKVIKEDITSKVKLVKVPKDTKEPLSVAEVKKVFRVLNLNEYSQFRDYVIMLVILDCGVRINELLNVKIEDYNNTDKTIRISSETAKTRESRVLPLSNKTSKYLRRLIKIAESNYEEYIFCSVYGDKIRTFNIIKNFEKYGKKAGITTKQTTPHQYRRTFAVQAVLAGIDIFTLQKMLGHASISTTRIYVNLDNSQIIRTHNKLNIINRFL